MNTHEVYSRDAAVYLVTGSSKFDALNQAIEKSGFIYHLLAHWNASGKPKEEFHIVVKPNIMTASVPQQDSPVYTDPLLVEALIQRMCEQCFTLVSVVEAENVYNYSYTGRSVQKVAEMCGYSGQGYRIANLSDEKVPFDYGGLLGEHVVGKTWLEADYRISFAKNKSHWQCYYTACLKNIYGCLPEWDKMHFYHGKRRGKNIEFFDACIEILDKLPVHFGFLDAWVSGDGLTGHVRDPHPNQTRMMLASENIFALDWVAGEKMHLHPLDNQVIQKAVQQWGTVNVTRVGDMTPWPDWDNVRPVVIKLLDFMEEYYYLSRFMSRTMAAQQDTRFPPVSRAQWFFNVAHKVVSFFDGLATKTVPAAAQPILIPMTMTKSQSTVQRIK